MKAAPRRYFCRYLHGLLVILIAVAAIGESEAWAADDPCRRPGTPLEAKALAKGGAEQAVADFMTPDGGFQPFDLYVLSSTCGGSYGSTVASPA